MPRILLALLLAAAFAAVGLALRRRGPAAVRAAAFFLAAIFLLKVVPLLRPPEAFLRDDFLFPLWALWETGGGWWWFGPPLVAVVVLLLLLARDRVPRPALLAAIAIAVWICLASTSAGWPEGLRRPFERSADYEADVPRFHSEAEIWRSWVDREEELSLHGSTHPPGAAAMLFALGELLGGDLTKVCVAVVALSSLTLVPLYPWARRRLGPEGGAIACVLWATTPAVLLYGATCMDMIFAIPLVSAMAVEDDPRLGPVVGGLLAGSLLGVGFLFTFASAVVAAAFALHAALAPREERRNAFLRLAAAAAACVGVLVAVRLATGFDAWACLRRAAEIDAVEASPFRSAWYWLVTRLMGALDFLVMAGAATAPAFLAGVRKGDRWGRSAVLASLLFLLMGAFKIGETGRIFLFFVPLAAIAAAEGIRPREAGWIVGINALQAFLFEFFLDTRW